jgi:glutamate-1-semialdehyde aminotransferase
MRIARRPRIVPFSDLAAVERALAPGDVALLMTEPAMTDAGFLLPGPGFHDGLRDLTRRHGTLLAIDKTHTLVIAYGGLTTEWGLEPDLLTVGKSIAGGVPLGAYGMTDDVAPVLRPPAGGAAVSGIAYDEVATGGALFANALSRAGGLADGLSRAYTAGRAVLPRRDRRIHSSRDVNQPAGSPNLTRHRTPPRHRARRRRLPPAPSRRSGPTLSPGLPFCTLVLCR